MRYGIVLVLLAALAGCSPTGGELPDDWPSEELYVREVYASALAVDALVGAANEAVSYYGKRQNTSIARTVESSRTDLADLRQRFEGRVPPAGFEERHEAMLRGWDLIDMSFGFMASAVSGSKGNPDVSLRNLQKAAEIMEQAEEKLAEPR